MKLSDEQAEHVAALLFELFSPLARRPPFVAWGELSDRERGVMRAKAKVLLEGMPG